MNGVLKLLGLLAFTGLASAASPLYSPVKLGQLPFCKTYGCQQVGKKAVADDIQPYITITYRLLKVDAQLESDHFPDGSLMGATLTFKRQPLNETDKQVALTLLKALTGGNYSTQVMDRCFAQAQKNAAPDDYFSSETTLAVGNINGDLNWVSKCYSPINGFNYSSLVTVYGTFH